MAVFPVCADDPILRFIRREYKASALRKPEERFQPLGVIAWNGKLSDYRGQLKPLLVDPDDFAPTLHEGEVSGIRSSKTKRINTNFGLQLLGDFLSGYGLDITPLQSSFGSVRQVSFSINNVKRCYIDKNELGRRLGRHRLQPGHLSLSVFREDPGLRFMLVNSVLVSNAFHLHIEKQRDGDFELSTELIEGVLKGLEGKVQIEVEKNRSLSFTGDTPLTFALTAFELIVDWTSGRFTGMRETRADLPTPLSGTEEFDVEIPLAKADELLVFDHEIGHS